MPRLSFSCLGNFTVKIDGKVITADFDTEKTKALLAYLVVEASRPQRRERLAGLLWSDQPDERALHNLRQRLSQLRKVLHEDTAPIPFLLIERDTVQLNPASDIWLDVRGFSAALEAAYRHSQRRNERGWLNIRPLKEALKLYQGQFLDQFYISGSALFDEWASLQREAYNRQAVEALALLAEYHERRGEYTLARQAVSRITDLAPWEETAQSQVMRLLALDHHWSAAQNQYFTLHRYLNQQLGVEPSRATVALFDEIRAAAAADTALSPRFPLTRHNLPETGTPFIGREADLDTLAEMLTDPECRLLTLLGPGGIGKTRLALQAGREQVGIFSDGVFFVPLASVRGGEYIPPAVADALGFSFSERGDAQTQLLDYLHNKRLLLVLDNFEHLLAVQGSTDLLVEILRQAHGVMLLVTSRQRLNLHEECVYSIEGMAYPLQGVTPVDLPESFDALALFARRARQVRSSFVLDTSTQPAVIRICQLLDGLPLGVELAAAASWEIPCSEIVERIASDLNILTTSSSNALPRHRSLHAAFDVSWELLSPAEQEAFCCLSVFRGGFEAGAAEHVAGSTPAILATLVNKSLLRRSTAGRYDMHEVVRQYAADKFAAMPDQVSAAMARYADFYASFLTGLNPELKGPGQATALEAIHLESENARHAWGWLVENQHSAAISQCADSLYQYFNIRSRFAEGIELFQQAIQALGGHETGELVLGMCLSRLGALAYRSRNNTLAQEALMRSQEIFIRLGASGELAFCLITLGGLQLRKKVYTDALACAHQSLSLYRTLEDGWGESYALYLLGLIKNRMSQYDEARSLFEDAVTIGRRLGIEHRLIAPLNLLGDIACIDGDYQAAESFFLESIEISRRMHDRFNEAILLNNLATIYQDRQQYTQEQVVLEQSLAICREIGDRDGEAIALNGLGEMAVHLGEYVQGVTCSQQALAIARQTDEAWTVIVCLNNLGEAYCELGEISKAEEHLRQALHLASEIGAMDLIARLMVTLGRVYQQRGEFSQATRLIQAALTHSAVGDEARAKAGPWLAEMGASTEVESRDAPLAQVLAEMLQG